MVLEPHTAYPIPAGIRYILLTVQKTVFGLDIIPETISPQLIENGFNLGNLRKMKRYDQKAYKLPPPTTAHVPAETNKRPLEEQPGPSSKSNISHLAFLAHANVFQHGGQYVSIKLSIASIPDDGKDPEVICLTVESLQPHHDLQRQPSNWYINERLNLKNHLPGSVPLEYLSFCVRDKFCHLTQGNRGLIFVKGLDQRNIFEKLGLFTINLEMLLHFQDLNDRTLPDHLYDEVHEDYDISECTMVKSIRFA
ncbi:uncharacterized protein TNCV_936931 [Trichonephila clavipes]|nr:uncharacterized protein TNCV_936931 [Trichonephila clavipes]